MQLTKHSAGELIPPEEQDIEWPLWHVIVGMGMRVRRERYEASWIDV
jgi:hypothetical protein